jgi:hypothetical protein
VSQLFPGKEVRIDARCVQTGDPITVRMKDGDVLEVSPDTAVGHANLPLAEWGQPSWAYT